MRQRAAEVSRLIRIGPALQQELCAVLADQPPWSDFPVIVLVAPGAKQLTYDLGNVTMLERPISRASMLAAVRSGTSGIPCTLTA